MKEDQPPTTFDQGTILSGMTGSGKFRAVFVTGPSNQNKAKKLAELGTAIVRKEPSSFCALMDARKTQSPYEWCSQFARTLRTMNGAEPMALAKFAMAVGRSLIPFKPGGAESNPENEANEKVVSKLVEHFEELTEHLPKGANSPKLVIVMDKFESMDNAMLEWLSSTVNQAFRKSPSFTASRFIFSANQKTSEISDFFNRFGFDKVHDFIFGGLSNPADTKNLESTTGKDRLSSDQSNNHHDHNLKERASRIPHSSKLEGEAASVTSDSLENAKKALSGYSDEQKNFITLASYAGKISRYALEFFSSNREAALCFNWLRRQNDICDKKESGTLSLNQNIIDCARIIHADENPEQSKKWSALSSVLDAFFIEFPDESTHWIPVNLYQFNWFNDGLLKKLFNDDQYIEIKGFCESHEKVLIGDEQKLSISEEKKVLIRRLLELSHLEPFPGLLDKAREQWLVDSEKSTNKKNLLETEKKNLTNDLEEAALEISNFNAIKEKLSEGFNGSGTLKPERIISFSSSILLIVIGLSTIGLSLMNDNLGSYHAACGLGLTLFGFFWPVVETKRAGATASITESPLTLDAQRRSLEHRVANLTTRLKVMKGNLEEVDAQIAKHGDNQGEPYVEIDE